MRFIAAALYGRLNPPSPFMDLDPDFNSRAPPAGASDVDIVRTDTSPSRRLDRSPMRYDSPPPRYPESSLGTWDPLREERDPEPGGTAASGSRSGRSRALIPGNLFRRGSASNSSPRGVEGPLSDPNRMELIEFGREPSGRPLPPSYLGAASPSALPLNTGAGRVEEGGRNGVPSVPRSPPPPYEPGGFAGLDPMDGLLFGDLSSPRPPPATVEVRECVICLIPLPETQRSSLLGVANVDEDPSGLLCVECRQNSIRLEIRASKRYVHGFPQLKARSCSSCNHPLGHRIRLIGVG
jgi:hypothetical protein